jgi:S-adenosylmethionine hydrolase
MSIITLLTDFGNADEYVGLMKGVILSIDPSAKIVDITHQIDPQDIIQAAYTIKASYHYFPQPCVHLIIVDPGVGTGRNILVFEKSGHDFVAPDNGVLSLVLQDEEQPTLLKVNNTNFFLESISRTFHGRDIFAPVGAHIANGVALKELGPRIHADDVVRLTDLAPQVSAQGDLLGRVVGIDRFGNLITNIDSAALNAHCKNKDGKTARILIGDHVIVGISETYANGQANAPVALIGSRGYLEIAVNKGSAKEQLQVAKGSGVRVSR